MELKSTVVEDKQRQQEEEVKEKHFHVLAVDDSLPDRKLLERLLKVSSYQVTCVDSGDKALEYLGLIDTLDCDSSTSSSSSSSSSSSQMSQQEGLKVNLIMTDFCMPGMSGYDLLKRLKGSSWKDVPVVVMSSENVPSRISMCLEGGAEEFLLKPLQLSDLKKIQPHLLKSYKNIIHKQDLNDSENGGRNGATARDGGDYDEDDDGESSSSSKSSNSSSKRKTISPEPLERRPKMKGVPVV